MSTLAAILVILSLVFGGSTATIVAAQSALPDQPLYGLKLVSEDVGDKLAFGDQVRFELALQFASRRVLELEKLMRKGETPPDELLARYQNHLENALRLAAGLPDEEFTPAMLRLQETLRQQEQILLRLRLQQPDSPLLNRLMAMVQTRLQLNADGLGDPMEFRNQIRSGQAEEFTPPYGQTVPPGEGAPTRGPGGAEPTGPGDAEGEGNQNPWTEESPEPGAGFGQEGGNPWTDDTPTPGSGYGYGDGNGDNPWTTGTPTPGSGYGDGSSANPWTTGTPTPGSGYGPGPGPN